MSNQKFSLGKLVATPATLDSLKRSEVLSALARHAIGDWGDTCPEDTLSNDTALEDGGRLFSVYHSKRGRKFWVITEADRSLTTVLFPEEY